MGSSLLDLVSREVQPIVGSEEPKKGLQTEVCNPLYYRLILPVDITGHHGGRRRRLPNPAR
jgi:hypothetical protein